MTLDQLRIFVAVARREHVSQAAKDLHLTQSAVSGALQALEARHQVRLFDRVGRGIRLNAAGRAFLVEAEAVLSRAKAAEAALDDLSALRRGRLSLWATPMLANYWLPKRLVAFRAAYPGVELLLEPADAESVVRAVLDGEAELGFGGVAPDRPELLARAVGFDQLVLAAPAGHEWAAARTLGAEDLRNAAWIMREAASGTRDHLEQGLRAYGVNGAGLTIALTLPSDEAVLGAIEAGGGVGALSESLALAAIEAGRVIRAPLPLPARRYFLLQRRERYLTRAAEAFLASLD